MEKGTITIFGSSLPKSGEKEYEDAYYIGKSLAKHGYNICSGGSQGIMDAVSKGAKEEGREAIGITVEIFNTAKSTNLTKEIECKTLFERLDNLTNLANGFIILPGGTGTLLEISLIWELMNKNIQNIKPAAALGSMWKNIITPMEKRVKIEKRKENLIKCFDTPDEIIKFMQKELE